PSVTPDERCLLEETDRDGLLLLRENKKKGIFYFEYFVPKEVYETPDDSAIIRAVTRIEIKALMQKLSIESKGIRGRGAGGKSKYNRIRNMILGSFPYDRKDGLLMEEHVNKIIAEAFEWLFLVENGFLPREDIPSEKKDFIAKIEPLIRAHRADLFTSEFWNWNRRHEVFDEAKRKGIFRFQTAVVGGRPQPDLRFLSPGRIDEAVAEISGEYIKLVRKQKRSLYGIDSFEEAFNGIFFKDLNKKMEGKRRQGLPSIIGGTGHPASGKTTVVDIILDDMERRVEKRPRMIYFDDWLIQKQDREIDPETGETTEEVLKKFEVSKFIRQMKLFAGGRDMVKSLYDTDAKGRIKIEMDPDGKVIFRNGKSLWVELEMREDGPCLVSYTKKDGKVDEAREVMFGNFYLSLGKTDVSGNMNIGISIGRRKVTKKNDGKDVPIVKLDRTGYLISAFHGGKRKVSIIKDNGKKADHMRDDRTGEVVASACTVLAVRDGGGKTVTGHIDENGVFIDKAWDIKEYIPSDGDTFCMVEGILSLYDELPEKSPDHLHNIYIEKFFYEADYEARLARGIPREKQRIRAESGKEATLKQIQQYAYKFWLRKRGEEFLISRALHCPGIMRISNQSRAESIFTLFKKGQLIEADNLAILKEIGVMPHRLNEQLLAMGKEYIVEYLSQYKNGSFGDDMKKISGTSFDVFFTGGGLVLKVYNKEGGFDDENAAFFEQKLKTRGGGLLAPGIIIDITDLNITEMIGKRKSKRVLGKVMIQNRGEPLRERVGVLIREKKIDEAKRLIDEYFELQKKMWGVGIIDLEPNMMDEYGVVLDNGIESVVAFISHSMTNDPVEYDPGIYDKDEEELPRELRGYYREVRERTVVSREKFTKKYFEKNLQNAMPLPDISHAAINDRQMDHIMYLMIMFKTEQLKKIFDKTISAAVSPEITWVRAYLETIVEYSVPRNDILAVTMRQLYDMLLEDPFFLDKYNDPEDLLPELWDKNPELMNRSSVQLFQSLEKLYQIHEEYRKALGEEKEFFSQGFQEDCKAVSRLLSDVIDSSLFEEDRAYTIRYNVAKLTCLQQKIVDTYAKLLRARANRPENIKVYQFYDDDKDASVIDVNSKSGSFGDGEGHVFVSLPEGDNMEDYLLRVTAMVNIALAASSIPNTAKDMVSENEFYMKYGAIVNYIKQ
ncbi:MAG: hypothetical protein ABIA77_04270, partial [Candidatus Omnitrophota bacterium]